MTNQQLIQIINVIQERITDESDMTWTTSYSSPKELRKRLKHYTVQLTEGKTDCIHELNILFAPTAILQEHSIMNGWDKEYLELAKQFDALYQK